jgi:tripartite ATP-independent transporter DctM subunit
MTALLIFLVTLFLGVPIFISIGLTAWNAAGQFPTSVLIEQMVSALNSFPLVTLPLFLLMGNVMSHAGITTSLVSFANVLVGRFRGGLSLGAIGSGVFFASISGSAVADTSALASVLVPAMKKEGYDPGYAGALVASAGTLGSIIPPSILLVIYGVQSGTSIEALFLAGVIPGLTVALGMAVIAVYTARRRKYPVHPSQGLAQAWKTTVTTLPVLVLPLIVILGVLTGIFTVTESAAAAVVYSLILTVAMRKFDVRSMQRLFSQTSIETAAVTIVIASSAALAWGLTRSQVPLRVTEFILAEVSNPVVILLMVNALLLFLGMFLAPAAGLILTTPLLMPLGNAMGMDPVQLGLMAVFNLNLGLLTPPVGLALFITARIAGTSLATQVRAVTPFLLLNLLVLAMITYWPAFSTTLPGLLRH